MNKYTDGTTKFKREPANQSVYITKRQKVFLDQLAEESSVTLSTLINSIIEREIRRVEVFKERRGKGCEK